MKVRRYGKSLFAPGELRKLLAAKKREAPPSIEPQNL